MYALPGSLTDHDPASSAIFGQIDDLSMPGAGLRNLDFSSDVPSMFADFLVTNPEANSTVQMPSARAPSAMPMQVLVRAYGSEQELSVYIPDDESRIFVADADIQCSLNAYYVFIHTYFPILPPRVTAQLPDRPLNYAGTCINSSSEEPTFTYRPRSPLSLAIAAILSLVPHPNDPQPSSANSLFQRRAYSHAFARMAINSIEADSELQSSSIDPSQALSIERPLINRQPLHPQTPVELENLLALLILSVYEYTQRGNFMKMRYRAGQALSMALDMSLHTLGEEQGEFAEARRRAWWMTVWSFR